MHKTTHKHNIYIILKRKQSLHEKEKKRLIATPGSYSPLKSPVCPQDKGGSSVTNDFEIKSQLAKVNYRMYD